ncbi:MAG: GntR family transcriptional regulator [Sulfobacillus sp.]
MSLVENPSQLAARYRDAIYTRRLAVGDRINLVEEARQLGVAPRILSQAMRLLANQGLVEWHPDQMVEVRALTTQSLQDMGYALTRRR